MRVEGGGGGGGIWQAKNLVPKSRVVDADRDGVADSHDGVGCLVRLNPISRTSTLHI